MCAVCLCGNNFMKLHWFRLFYLLGSYLINEQHYQVVDISVHTVNVKQPHMCVCLYVCITALLNTCPPHHLCVSVCVGIVGICFTVVT